MKWLNVGVGAFGLLGNLVVMLVVLRVKKLRQQPRNWFIFHQSLADFVSAMFIIAMATRTVDFSLFVSSVSYAIFIIITWPSYSQVLHCHQTCS